LIFNSEKTKIDEFQQLYVLINQPTTGIEKSNLIGVGINKLSKSTPVISK